MWVQLKICQKKLLYGTFCMPHNSNIEVLSEVERSVESAVNDVNCDQVIITGDFILTNIM